MFESRAQARVLSVQLRRVVYSVAMAAVAVIAAGLLLLFSAAAHKIFHLKKVRYSGLISISYAMEDEPKLNNAAGDGVAAGGEDDSHDRLTSNVRSSGRPGIFPVSWVAQTETRLIFKQDTTTTTKVISQNQEEPRLI